MAEVNFELYNNQLVQQLVGASDANLRLIEKILNVEISSFGNQINIKGSQDAVDQVEVEKARSFFGKYSAVTLMAAGKFPASPMPSMIRAAMK